MLKKLVILAMLAVGFNQLAVAHENPNQKTTCYKFAKDKLVASAKCTVESGGGAGGMYTNMVINGKRYNYESPLPMDGDMGNSNNENEYTRNAKTFKRYPNNANIPQNAKLIFCQKDKPYDICYLAD